MWGWEKDLGEGGPSLTILPPTHPWFTPMFTSSYTLLIRSYTLPLAPTLNSTFFLFFPPPLTTHRSFSYTPLHSSPLLFLHTHTTNRYAKAAEAKEKARSRKYFGYPDPKLAWKGYWALSQMLRRKTFIEECKQEEGDVRRRAIIKYVC